MGFSQGEEPGEWWQPQDRRSCHTFGWPPGICALLPALGWLRSAEHGTATQPRPGRRFPCFLPPGLQGFPAGRRSALPLSPCPEIGWHPEDGEAPGEGEVTPA